MRSNNRYKKQHFVPQCYTKAWHDPTVLAGPVSTPFVWLFDKDGSNQRRKAPSNLFTETDIYTIQGIDGGRDLTLEHGFQELEDKFTRIRNLAFNRMKWPDQEQMAWLFAFVATAQMRTQANRDHHRQQWSNIRKMMEESQAAYDNASPSKKRAFERMTHVPSSSSDSGMTLEQVRDIEEYPLQFVIGNSINTVTRVFARMNVAVLCTEDPIGFITSDHPCIWYDPEAYKLPPFYRGPGLGVKTIEVTLPISPKQCLIITHNPNLQGFIEINSNLVDQLNHRHIAHCNESFISCSQNVRPIWFEKIPVPEDAWEKVRERRSEQNN
ncbi:hypothetical protein AAKU58_004275 [Oxalobacteraceae bacterium GrIS 1.18]